MKPPAGQPQGAPSLSAVPVQMDALDGMSVRGGLEFVCATAVVHDGGHGPRFEFSVKCLPLHPRSIDRSIDRLPNATRAPDGSIDASTAHPTPPTGRNGDGSAAGTGRRRRCITTITTNNSDGGSAPSSATQAAKDTALLHHDPTTLAPAVSAAPCHFEDDRLLAGAPTLGSTDADVDISSSPLLL